MVVKTFVILSDSHGHRERVEKLRALFAENDYIVHLGDGRGDMRDFAREYPEKIYAASGNCDRAEGCDEGVIEAEKLSVFYCHGHKYGVKSTLTRLAARAKEKGCEVALYGHTHRYRYPRGGRRAVYQSRRAFFVHAAELLLSGFAQRQADGNDRADIKKSG